MCKKKLQEFFPQEEPETNLSISLTWADDFSEGNNTVYTISWTLTWVIWSPNTVLTATLPAWITYVSSSGGGSESGGVITWTLGDIIANGSRTFTITSSTQDTYELLAHIEGDYTNLGTADASKEIEVTEASLWIEVRLKSSRFSDIWFPSYSEVAPVLFEIPMENNLLPWLTIDFQTWITSDELRLWYYNGTIPTWVDWYYQSDTVDFAFFFWTPNYNWSWILTITVAYTW